MDEFDFRSDVFFLELEVKFKNYSDGSLNDHDPENDFCYDSMRSSRKVPSAMMMTQNDSTEGEKNIERL